MFESIKDEDFSSNKSYDNREIHENYDSTSKDSG